MNRLHIVKTDTAYEIRQATDDGQIGGEIANAAMSTPEAITAYRDAAKQFSKPKASDLLWTRTYADAYAETEDDLMASLAAEGAIKKASVVGYSKSADLSIVKGWGMIFTGKQKKDLHDTYFDHRTQTLLEYYEGAPLWYEHGLDEAYGDIPIGKRLRTQVYPRGIWAEHKLHQDHPLFPRTEAEVKANELVLSSDTSSIHVIPRMRTDGGYGSWPLIGWTLTKDPAEPALGRVSMKSGRKLYPGISFKSADEQAEARKAQSQVNGDAKAIADKTKPTTEVKKMPNAEEMIAALAGAFDCKPELAEVKTRLVEMTTEYDDRDDSEELESDELEMLNLEEGSTVALGKSVLTGFIRAIEPRMINVSAMGKAAKLLAKSNKQRRPTADDDDDDDLDDKVRGDDDDDEDVGDRYVEKLSAGRKKALADGGAKSTTYASIYQHRGHKMPGLTQMIMGMLEGKSKAHMKSLGYINGVNGGWLVRREMSQTMLPRFYANTILDKLGATTVPMAGIDSLLYRKEKNGMDAYWRGERQLSSETAPDYGYVMLNLKELVAATTIPVRLLNTENVNLEQRLMDDMAKACRLKYDIAALTGAGAVTAGSSGAEPLGLLNYAAVNKVSMGTDGGTPSPDDFLKRWLALYEEDLPISDTFGIAMSPRDALVMKNTRDLTGQLLEPTAFTQGYAVATTSQISVAGTTGASTDTSNIFFGDWQYVIVGQGQDVEFRMSEHTDMKKGLIYFEANVMVDIAIAYTEAFEILQGVRGFIA